MLAGLLVAGVSAGSAAGQWPNGFQSSDEPPNPASALRGCMIGRLSDIRYTIGGDRDEEKLVDQLFDRFSASFNVLSADVIVFDGPDSYNALATPENLVSPNGEGTVLIGRRLIATH